jgi:hypothetical protein
MIPRVKYPVVKVQSSLFSLFSISSSSNEVVEYSCLDSIISNESHWCSSGVNITLNCNGTVGIFHQRCPVFEDKLVCQFRYPFSSPLNNIEGVSSLTCEAISATSESITCQCLITSSSPISRRLGLRSLSESESDSNGFVVGLSTASETILHDFTSTWSSAGDLSLRSVGHSWKVLVTVGSLGIIFVLSLLFGYYEDQRSKLNVMNEEASKHAQTEKPLVQFSSTNTSPDSL